MSYTALIRRVGRLCLTVLALVDVSGMTWAATLPRGSGPAALQATKPPGAQQQELTLSDELSSQVLEPLCEDMQAQDISAVVALFDQDFAKSIDLQRELRAFFAQYSQVRLRYQLLQQSGDDRQASATADMDMDAQPYDVSRVPQRRTTQMRFQFRRDGTTWKIVGISPAGFFSVDFAVTNNDQHH